VLSAGIGLTKASYGYVSKSFNDIALGHHRPHDDFHRDGGAANQK
jgi:hypothetical protein